MNDEIRSALARIAEQAPAAQLRGVTGTYRFESTEGGSCTAAIEQGAFTVREGGEPDCTLRCAEGDLLRILRGEQDLLTAAMQGRVELEGSLPLAQRLLALIRAGQRAA